MESKSNLILNNRNELTITGIKKVTLDIDGYAMKPGIFSDAESQNPDNYFGNGTIVDESLQVKLLNHWWLYDQRWVENAELVESIGLEF